MLGANNQRTRRFRVQGKVKKDDDAVNVSIIVPSDNPSQALDAARERDFLPFLQKGYACSEYTVTLIDE